MFIDFVLGWGANFVGIVKGGRVSKSLRTSATTLKAGVRYIRTWLYRYAVGMVLRVTLERARCCFERLCWENHAC